MAIRFVDVKPDAAADKAADAEPAPTRRTRAPGTARGGDPTPESAPAERAPFEPAAPAEAPPEPAGSDAAPAEAEAPLPGLTHAKPEPKPRGRKRPMSAAGADRPENRQGEQKPQARPGAPSAPLLEGLLPELAPGLQAHAKPTPKPRGRKKAFG